MNSQANHHSAAGQLFIVATPIGNLADITMRALEVLKSVDLIAAEDTRTSRKLLNHYGISTPMLAVHEHNEERMAEQLARRLRDGESIALISDAGTPLISDPGFRLVRRLKSEGLRVTPIPGASSIITALCAAGLPTDAFTYLGFLPRSGKARQQALDTIREAGQTVVLLESPKRLLATLRDIAGTGGGDREASVARELTKLHETILTDRLEALIDHFAAHEARGECVLLIGPATAQEASDTDILRLLEQPEMAALPPSARARKVAQALNVSKSHVYQLILEQR